MSGVLYLDCKAADRAFCDRLAAEFERLARVKVVRGFAGPDGAMAARVTVAKSGVASADAVLEAGVLKAGALHPAQRQTLRIDVADANFGAGSATSLVYPLTKLLGL